MMPLDHWNIVFVISASRPPYTKTGGPCRHLQPHDGENLGHAKAPAEASSRTPCAGPGFARPKVGPSFHLLCAPRRCLRGVLVAN